MDRTLSHEGEQIEEVMFSTILNKAAAPPKGLCVSSVAYCVTFFFFVFILLKMFYIYLTYFLFIYICHLIIYHSILHFNLWIYLF